MRISVWSSDVGSSDLPCRWRFRIALLPEWRTRPDAHRNLRGHGPIGDRVRMRPGKTVGKDARQREHSTQAGGRSVRFLKVLVVVLVVLLVAGVVTPPAIIVPLIAAAARGSAAVSFGTSSCCKGVFPSL